ncbi:MAG: DUF2993 domain-containing protein [Microcoleus anatoxicus]|uniref:LmeA family phospholipid-binding protein n=1 Tax=Microcoleus anatoxicus TaxID=2705319 RepID=UPI00367068B7
MIQPERSLGEQAIDKVVEIAISSQLDESESLSVNVQTQPMQLAQGEVDSVTIDGEGLVLKQDLRVAKLQVKVNDISVNPLSAMFGKAVSLEDVEYPKNQEISADLTLALAAIASEVLDLRNIAQKLTGLLFFTSIFPHPPKGGWGIGN